AALALQFIADDELPVDGALAFQPTTLNLGRTADQANYTITNVTASTITWTMDEYIDAIDNPAMVVDGSVFTSSKTGQLAPGASQQLTLSIDRELLSEDGFYRIWLVFEVPGEPEQLYQVRFQRSGASAPSLKGPMIVAAFQQDALGNLVTSGEQQSANAFSSFDFQVEPGMNLLGAWSDEDDDGLVNAGDYIGFADDFVNVPAGGHASGLTLRIDPVIPEFDYEADQPLMLLERLRPER